MNWLSFLIGGIVGGGIVYYFFRTRGREAEETERLLRERLADSERETRDFTSQLDGPSRQEEKLVACQAELQKRTQDLQQVTEQLATAETQIRSLREQFAAAETSAEELSAAQIQIQKLREQLAAVGSQPETATKEPLPAVEEARSDVQPDDLTKIEGIGPKVAQTSNESGIFTFVQLAQTDAKRLRAILQDAGPRFRMIEPESWPEQAGLATNGDWDALTKLQDELDGGKYRH
ncbi:MAG: helix-hairpin-helix domain-containing protein [Candidatus Vecturithrix sp.]|jgi:large subunit ribosomal protein L17|nr:helix-hairpin-helix domain-containing protein [Candidatus Vecturithrix sp.]